MKSLKILFVMLCILIMILNGCSEKKDNAYVDEGIVKAVGESIVEDILKAGNEMNYQAFSQDFSQEMIKSLGNNMFEKLIQGFESRIGKYESKEFVKLEYNKPYIALVYKAKYTHEPGGVMVRVVLEKLDNEYVVSGLFYDSPKLRKN